MITVKFKRIHPLAQAPMHATTDSAGADLYAAPAWPITINPGRSAKVGTGVAIELPRGVVALVCPRSGLAFKHGVTVLNAPGVIDADFRGEVSVLLVNHGHEPVTINPGDRIAQLVLMPCFQGVNFTEADELSESERGEGGWGSTGQ